MLQASKKQTSNMLYTHTDRVWENTGWIDFEFPCLHQPDSSWKCCMQIFTLLSFLFHVDMENWTVNKKCTSAILRQVGW